jgi:hypothetical protein
MANAALRTELRLALRLQPIYAARELRPRLPEAAPSFGLAREAAADPPSLVRLPFSLRCPLRRLQARMLAA